MLDLNLSPLGVETTCTPVSKFSSNFYSDAADWDPSVKIFSDNVDWNEFRQVDQGQVVLAASNRRNTLMEWLVNMTILRGAPNYLHNHDVNFTYKAFFNMIQRKKGACTVFHVSNSHGEPPDQVASDWHIIIVIVKGLSQNNMPNPPIKIVPRFILNDSKVYDNIMFIKPSIYNPTVDEISKQWKHRKAWDHMKSFLFNSGDPSNLFKPVVEWGEKAKSFLVVTFAITPQPHIQFKPSYRH
jgi:hypothetical protein